MATEIRVLQNREKQTFRVTINGKDAYEPFTYTDDPDTETEARRAAKACAFDEALREQYSEYISVHYDIF
jgi:hypothetical protein